MVLIHYGKRHNAYAYILEMLMLFSRVPRCGQLGRAALFKPPTPGCIDLDSLRKAVDLLFGLALGTNPINN